MATSAEMIRSYRGPAILSYGFRPLFLLAGVWAALAMAVWSASLSAGFVLPSAYGMLDWHVHELLFGYVPAVVAGFLLTAVPNWTGRLPVVGTPLLVLVLVWLAGRAAMLLSAAVNPWLAAVIDMAFLAMLMAVIAREILAGSNWRNLKVLVLIGLLLAANGLFHYEAIGSGAAATGYSARFGLSVTLMLIMLIGGRIVPSFTHNWLARRGEGAMPVSFNRFDAVVMAASALTFIGWVLWPDERLLAILFVIAGGLNLWRLYRWAGYRASAEPLVLVLHAAYAFIPLGFFTGAIALAWPQIANPGAFVHAWTAGAVALMTLAVMTRASLGHTGQPLRATPAIASIYVLVALSAVFRILAGFNLVADVLIYAAAALWIAGYTLFVILYAPLFLKPRG